MTATKRKGGEGRERKPDPYPIVVETFMTPDYYLDQLRDDEPAAINGIVRVVRYRVTAERIAEPIEVIHERLRKLWRSTNNHHHYGPLLAAAKEHGLELARDEFGTTPKGK